MQYLGLAIIRCWIYYIGYLFYFLISTLRNFIYSDMHIWLLIICNYLAEDFYWIFKLCFCLLCSSGHVFFTPHRKPNQTHVPQGFNWDCLLKSLAHLYIAECCLRVGSKHAKPWGVLPWNLHHEERVRLVILSRLKIYILNQLWIIQLLPLWLSTFRNIVSNTSCSVRF